MTCHSEALGFYGSVQKRSHKTEVAAMIGAAKDFHAMIAERRASADEKPMPRR